MDIEIPSELTAYLRATNRVGAGEPLEIHNLAGGVSNRTVLVKRPSGEAWVLKQALAKLRVAVDWFSDPARVDREALGIDWLNRLVPGDRVPKLIFHDSAQHLLAMQAVPQPHENFKTVLLAGRVEADHIRQFAELLAEIHANACLRRTELPAAFEDRQYFENLRLEPYYAYAAGQVPAAAKFLHALIAATRTRLFTLVHGDYSPKNVLIFENRLILLDHEVIHIGDPAFDLGFALTHLLSKAHHLGAGSNQHRTAFLTAARNFWSIYHASLLKRLPPTAACTTNLESFAVQHTLGCLMARVAGRSQLEYLTPNQKTRQREAVLGLLQNPPPTIQALIEAFANRL